MQNAFPSLLSLCAVAVLASTIFTRPSPGTSQRSELNKQNAHTRTSAAVSPDHEDADADGVSDILEQELAEKYAPIVFHSKYEKNFPWNVQDFLAKTSLFFFDESCDSNETHNPQRSCAQAPSNHSGMSCLIEKKVGMQASQIYQWHNYDSCPQKTYYAHGLLDRDKRVTFYLSDVSHMDRKGTLDTTKWITYYHAYGNDKCTREGSTERCGITIQYWRFYAYNTGPIPGGIGSHGADWEGSHVVLNQDYQPAEVRLLGHRGIAYYRAPKDQPWCPNSKWGALAWEGNHPKITSENGGHSSRPFKDDDESHYIRQETWKGGRVRWSLSQHHYLGQYTTTDPSPLRNLGEKTKPMSGMHFIQYSGLWGSPGRRFPLLGPINSGYWGPGYNETGERKDGFITAWCEGMKSPDKEIEVDHGVKIRECYRPTSP
jgi:hypothetical protein